MCSLERSEKILSTFDTFNIIAGRSLQNTSKCQLNIPSMGNRKKENKINFLERHLPKTLAFLGWYYILKIHCVSSLICCCQHLKFGNFVCLIFFFLSLFFQVILPFLKIFLTQKHLCLNSLVLLKCFTTCKIHLLQMFFYYTRGWKLK